jgi:hypothetical protein
MFRERLDLPLVAVELAYGRDFELRGGDADILIRLRGRDVMWQKERLLNVGFHNLPARCDKVVWLDCDVLFEEDDWPERLDELLDFHPLVQAFSRVHHVGPDWTPDSPGQAPLFTQPSILALLAEAPNADPLASRVPSGAGSSNKGLAWAARRELTEKHGLYDACILGGGDLGLVSAVQGSFGAATRTMNDRQAEHYLRWAEPWHEAVRGRAGVLDGTLLHLWHGDVEDRGYRERHDVLHRHDFDPSRDIALDDNGSWRWSTDKPGMHDSVRAYFAARREDGIE